MDRYRLRVQGSNPGDSAWIFLGLSFSNCISCVFNWIDLSISIFNLYGYVVLLFFLNSFFICMAILEVKLVDQPLALLAWEELVVLWQNEQTALEWKFFITTETGVKQMRKNLVRYFVRVQDVDPLLSTSPLIVKSATLFKARTWFISFRIQNCVVEYPISTELDFLVKRLLVPHTVDSWKLKP